MQRNAESGGVSASGESWWPGPITAGLAAARRSSSGRQRPAKQGGGFQPAAWPWLKSWLFILPAAAILIALTLYPLAFAFGVSLFDYDVLTNTAWFIGIENFQSMLEAGFPASLRTTLLFAIPAVAIELVLGVALAVLLESRVLDRARPFIRLVVLLPLLMAPVITGAMFKLMLNPGFGVLAALIGGGDGSHVDILGNGTTALMALIFIDIWMWTPFVVLLATAALASIPYAVYEASAIDGAGPWRQFRHISLPLLRPALAIVLLFRLIDCIKIADIPYAVTQGGPGSSTDVLSLLIYRTSFKLFDIGQGAAMSVVLIALVMVPVLFLFRATRPVTRRTQ